MKTTSILLVLLLAPAANLQAEQTVDLNSRHVKLHLNQRTGETLNDRITIRRTTNTPKAVYLHFPMKYENYECVDSRIRDVWRTGSCSCDSAGNTTCSPGYWGTETYCFAYDWVDREMKKTLKLRFRKANRLRGNDEEVFLLNFSQKNSSYQNTNVTTLVEPLKVKRPYKEIKFKDNGILRKDGVYFTRH